MSDPVRAANLLRQSLYFTQLAYWLLVCVGVMRGWFDHAGMWICTLVMLVLIGLELAANRRYGRLRLHHQGEPLEEPSCPACGYKLVGLASTRCPECGRPFKPHDQPITTLAERLSWAALIRSMTLGILVSTGLLLFAFIRYPLPSTWPDLSAGFAGLNQWIQATQTALPGWLPMIAGSIAGYLLVILVTYLVGRRRMKGYLAPIPIALPCAGCGKEMPLPLIDACPHCARPVMAEDVFVRCKPWNLNDRRFRRFHRLATAGQVVLNVLIFVILIVMLVLRQHVTTLRITLGETTTLILAILVLLAGLVLLRQRVARTWGRKIWLIFSQAVPSCPHCDADLTGRPIHGPCPRCHKIYDPTDLHG